MADVLGGLTRTHYCGSLREDHVGATVTLMGWADTRRDLGGVVFIDLRDREGICQIVARPEVSKEAHAAAEAAALHESQRGHWQRVEPVHRRRGRTRDALVLLDRLRRYPPDPL